MCVHCQKVSGDLARSNHVWAMAPLRPQKRHGKEVRENPCSADVGALRRLRCVPVFVEPPRNGEFFHSAPDTDCVSSGPRQLREASESSVFRPTTWQGATKDTWERLIQSSKRGRTSRETQIRMHDTSCDLQMAVSNFTLGVENASHMFQTVASHEFLFKEPPETTRRWPSLRERSRIGSFFVDVDQPPFESKSKPGKESTQNHASRTKADIRSYLRAGILPY